MSGYGQFCPLSRAMALLDERWTMLVVVHGPGWARRSVPRCWLGRSPLAGVPRVAAAAA